MTDECDSDKPGPTCLASHGVASLWPWGEMTYGTDFQKAHCHKHGGFFWYTANVCTASEAA